jgi:hypothetical protein
MPNCFCTSFGCATVGGIDPATNSPRGIPVDIRTFKSHQLRDGAAAAREASKRAIAAQDVDIVQFISTMTLADKVSGAPEQQGGRLWSKSDPGLQDLGTMMGNLSLSSPEPQIPASGPSVNFCNTKAPNFPSSKPSGRNRLDSAIRRLVEIEASVAELVKKASNELADLTCYSRDSSISFPLEPLLVACTDLRNQLEGVGGKQAAVVETKRSIVEQLDDIQRLLEKRKRNWEPKRTDIAADTAAENGLKTGWSPALQDLPYLTVTSLYRPSFPPFPSERRPHPSGVSLHGRRLPHCPKCQPSRMQLCALHVAVHCTTRNDAGLPALITSRAKVNVGFPS